ncbi:hypothetical protein RHGRI_001793 [Rhododendron griersonianum]|uniref:Aminotransferase-like plant mobile domain-containing protein n=1 Tax=Rhododendron griersonianum TaxID=479676 RepID=A0AAV6LMC7_9ERIC|nr:hypothetical protein RHGRI_001793 [Rhododendron griersonianum]
MLRRFFELCSATSSSSAPPFLRALRLRCCYFFELCSAVSSSSAPQLPQALRFCEEMVLFNDRSIDDHQILSISYEGAAPATQVDLWVHDPAIGALALDWDLSPDSHHLSRCLHTPIGEVSISLWDLCLTGGLSIDGIFYDEAVPSASAREFTGVYKKSVRNWFKEEPRYKQPPARVQKKRLSELRTSNNPTGFIGEKKPRSKDTEKVFDDLGVEKDVKEETNLAALLSCWLCVFVLPNKEVDQIRPGVFKVASMMAQGKRFSLAVLVLASIYHGLREITSSPNPSKCGAVFSIHYVYGWLGCYYDSYFLSTSTKSNCGARIVRLAREKKAKHFSFQEACDLLKSIAPLTLSLLALGKPQHGIVTDHGKHSDSWNDYVISLRSSYLTLRRGNEHIVEPYNPHRFGRQFRFCQDIPGKLREELSTGTLEAIYQLWEFCTRLNTRAEFMIPSHSSEGLATKEYVEWWEKSLSNFCKDKLACEKPNSPSAAPKGKNVVTIPIVKSKLATVVTPPLSKSKEKEMTKAVTKESEKVATVKPRTPLSIPASKRKRIVIKASEPMGENKKRTAVVLSEESSSDKGDCHWKRLKKKATDSDSRLKEKVMVSDLVKLDFNLDVILDDLPDTSNHLELENQFASDEREGSVDGPDPFDLALRPQKNSLFGAMEIHPPSSSKPPMLGRAALSTVTAFDTGSMINCDSLLAAKIYDSNIKSILGKTPFEKLTSLRPKLQVIYAEFSKLE